MRMIVLHGEGGNRLIIPIHRVYAVSAIGLTITVIHEGAHGAEIESKATYPDEAQFQAALLAVVTPSTGASGK